MDSSDIEHVPVLATTLAEQISLPQDAVMVDATVGQGGHSLLFGRTLGPEGMVIGLDVDVKSIQRAQGVLNELACKVVLKQSNFSEIRQQVLEQHKNKVDFILADLGVSSSQLADIERGLSFQENMPLDMRLDDRLTLTAADIVNRYDEKSLADLIYKYSDERASRRIARYIVEARKAQPIRSTAQLASVVCKALSKKTKGYTKIHPATRTFQALRIAVNHELENLEKLLNSAADLLKTEGLIAVISFHSLEDRLIKNNFKENAKNHIYRIITKKPILPSGSERLANRRARSAKLRIAQKI